MDDVLTEGDPAGDYNDDYPSIKIQNSICYTIRLLKSKITTKKFVVQGNIPMTNINF